MKWKFDGILVFVIHLHGSLTWDLRPPHFSEIAPTPIEKNTQHLETLSYEGKHHIALIDIVLDYHFYFSMEKVYF